jgi:hypothetical protein
VDRVVPRSSEPRPPERPRGRCSLVDRRPHRWHPRSDEGVAPRAVDEHSSALHQLNDSAELTPTGVDVTDSEASTAEPRT